MSWYLGFLSTSRGTPLGWPVSSSTAWKKSKSNFSQRKTTSSSGSVRGCCGEGLSLRGGTRRDSIVERTSFHMRVMTVIILVEVRVCCMIAKLSSR